MKISFKDPAWQKLPFFKSELEKGNVWLWDSTGATRELSEEHKKKIKEMEEDWKVKVIAVLDGTYDICGNEAHMVSYMYLDDEYEPWIIEDDVVGFYANVVNDAWDIEEAGSVGVEERVGMLRRVM